MKASDSVNSLTELNPSGGSTPSCFICLSEDLEEGEPLVDSKLLRNCGCRFSVHPACWNEWLKNKSDFDCPICHKASMLRIHIPPNPILSIAYQEEPRSKKWSPYKIGLCLLVSVATGFLVTAILQWG